MGQALAIQIGVTFITETCCYTDCGVMFAMPDHLRARLKETGDWFYCPHGHKQHYTESTVQKLERELAQARSQRDSAQNWARTEQARVRAEQHRTRAYRGQVTKIRNRIANGVCPCCKRTFANVARHMKTQHPTVTEPNA